MDDRWTYPKEVKPPRGLSRPEWGCPEDACVCHPVDNVEEEVELEIVLRDYELQRMGGAVCYVESPALIGDPIVVADGEGAIKLTCWYEPKTIVLNWAPPGLPKGPPWPYRKVYYVDLREGDEAESTARRLHNLGFSDKPSLEENIAEFQRSYGYTMSGEVPHAKGPLVKHHEGREDIYEGDEPIQGDVSMAFDGGQSDPVQAGSFDDPTKSQDQKKGCASSVPAMPSPFAVRKQLVFEWTPITSVYKNLTAVFWVLRDAAKWWVPSKFFPDWHTPPTESDPIHNGFYCRLPTTAQQNQAVANKTMVTPRKLNGPDEPRLAPAACLLMTPKLYNLRYEAADGKVPPQFGSTKRCMFLESKKLNLGVNQEAKAYTNPTIVADAGKAWVIVHQINRVRAVEVKHYGAYNYGWHKKNGTVAQPAAREHCACHFVDYSQLLYMVAGFCLLEDGDSDVEWVRTRKIYLNTVRSSAAVNRAKEYHRLAVGSPTALPDYRYTKFGNFP